MTPFIVCGGRPQRVQLSRKKGWRMPPNTVSVARPGPFGNPWTVKDAGAAGYGGNPTVLAAWCVSLYRDWLTDRPGSLTAMLGGGPERLARLRERLPSIRGKNLACWCPLVSSHGDYSPCHADVLLSLANDIPMDEVVRENTRRAKGEAL